MKIKKGQIEEHAILSNENINVCPFGPYNPFPPCAGAQPCGLIAIVSDESKDKFNIEIKLVQ